MFLQALGKRLLIQAKLEPFPPVSEKNVTQGSWARYVSQALILAICRNSPSTIYTPSCIVQPYCTTLPAASGALRDVLRNP